MSPHVVISGSDGADHSTSATEAGRIGSYPYHIGMANINRCAAYADIDACFSTLAPQSRWQLRDQCRNCGKSSCRERVSSDAPVIALCNSSRKIRLTNYSTVVEWSWTGSVPVTWLILPVVICLSQRLSHACLSISFYTAKLRMAH